MGREHVKPHTHLEKKQGPDTPRVNLAHYCQLMFELAMVSLSYILQFFIPRPHVCLPSANILFPCVVICIRADRRSPRSANGGSDPDPIRGLPSASPILSPICASHYPCPWPQTKELGTALLLFTLCRMTSSTQQHHRPHPLLQLMVSHPISLHIYIACM
jgi:hypothetical protein